MRFRFIGDPHDNFSGPDALEMAGHRFTRNGWTEVSDRALAAKLEVHSHFDVDYAQADLSPVDASIPVPVEHPHKKGGWPKGRPRGPRKHDV